MFAKSTAPADAAASTPSPAVHRVIVKMRDGTDGGGTSSRSAAHLQRQVATPEMFVAMAERHGLAVAHNRRILPGLNALHVIPQNPRDSLATTLARLRADPDVEYAEADQRRYVSAVPNDPFYLATPGATGQWFLMPPGPEPSSGASAIDALDAWSETTGSPGLVIADIDTGVRFDHPDLLRAGAAGRLLQGYTFISDALVANDGTSSDSSGNAQWDSDASDPGDWVTSTDVANFAEFSGCTPAASSWHGTRVAGILGAITNNTVGIAGLTWSGWILPVRALGKCNGEDSDIETAMLWAAGLQVTDNSGNNVPLNPYPARIINLSLAAPGACPNSYAAVISQLTAMGVTVVAAAGNEGGPVDAPANCSNVIAVAGVREDGTKVGFSSLGPQIALSAPGGNCVNVPGACLFSLDTTTNSGAMTPALNTYTNQSNPNVGTSFAAPQISGIAGLMLSVNGNLSPAQILARLQEGATTPFPTPSTSTTTCHVPANSSDLQTAECNCTTQTCGAGMANANGAVTAALRPIAALVVPSSVNGGANVSFDAAGSAAACGRTITTYQWSVITGGSTVPVGGNNSSVSVAAPNSGSEIVQVVVTDSQGGSDTAQASLTASSASSAAPANAGSNACLTPITPVLPVTVTVAPAGAALKAGVGTQTFTASVTSTSNTSVTWLVNGIAGGNDSVGHVSTSGVYTPPASPPLPPNVSVVAVSVASPVASGFAGVVLNPPVTVSVQPASASVGSGAGTQQFTATVSNASNTEVTWQVNAVTGGNATVGTISGGGLYSAPCGVPNPATVTVTAISVADSTRSGSAQITVTAGAATAACGAAGGGGGGGGALQWPAMLLLAGAAAWVIRVRRRAAAVAAAVLWALGASMLAHADSQWVAGKNYFLITPAQPTGAPPGKIEVTEVFSYACPGCNRFYPIADRLQSSLPANAVMDLLPASFRPDEDWPMFQRAYLAAKELGIDKRTHDAMFDAVWKTGELAVFDPQTQRAKRPVPTINDAAGFYERAAGVKPETFVATATSFAVDVKMRQADELIRNYGVSETPSIVVNGKYRLNPVSAGGYDQTIELVKWLVAQESVPRH
jgi:serine protease